MEAMQDGADSPREPEPEVLGAVGAANLIGSLTAQNSLGRVLLLHQIDSPMLMGDDDEKLEMIDIARALFIMAHGAEAMQPIYSVERRLKELNRREPKSNESLYAIWLDKIDDVTAAESDFDVAALTFLEENFNHGDISQVEEMLMTLITEQLKPLESMPESQSTNLADKAEKKN
jgi:hypothetical protein